MDNQNSKVFIVDDEPLLLEMLADYIKENNSNLDVSCFSTGEECLKSMHLHPDLIVLDYYLNSKEKDAANGLDILKEMKEIDRALPVIMLSSQKSYSTAAKTIGYGAMNYVVKGKAAFAEIYQLIKANV